MIKIEGYQRGANLGHWLSQYGNQSDPHFRNYIQKKDLKRISSWGMDHVRVPIDYMLFENDSKPYQYIPARIKYIDNVVSWCEKFHLNIILDLHHAPGFFFGNKTNTLFSDPEMQNRYLAIWDYFAKRYGSKKHVAFELLNELVAPTTDDWNKLYPRAVETIRKSTKDTYIFVGPNWWNGVDHLCELELVDDPNVFYTFHFYQPMEFTHQRASWIEDLKKYTVPVHYPFAYEEHKAYFEMTNRQVPAGNVDIEFIRKLLQPGFDFIEKTGRPLYCGEFGVIANADVEDAKRWCKDLLCVLHEHGIGHAVWSYRGFSSVTNNQNEVVDMEYVDILSK